MGHLGIANKYLQAMGYDAISQTVHRILLDTAGGGKLSTPNIRSVGVLYLYEVKYGPKAHLTNNQKINIPKLQNKQATFIPIGKNAMKVKDFIECAKSRTPFSGLFDVTVRWF